MECNDLYEPSNYDEIVELVQKANINNRKIHVIGTGLHHVKDGKFDICISTRRINKIIESSVADLYVTVQSGVLFEELQKYLTERGLFFPAVYNGTVGGLFSTNFPTPFSLWYPYPKDLLLGAKIVTGDGKVIKSGGKTTKFSSGYKIWKLLSGALGTLGIYVELNVKVLPKPERIVSVKVQDVNEILSENPVGILSVLDSSSISHYAIFMGFSSYIEKISKEKETIDGIIGTELECDRIFGIVTPRGLELEFLKRVNNGIAFYGGGYVKTCDEKALALREKGITVIIERGCKDNEDCFGYSYKSMEILKNSLDPNHVLT